MRSLVADTSAGRLRVLLVEDEALVRLMLGEMLSELGHEVVAEASNLDTAITAATETDYDLAVLDLNLGNGITYDVVEVVLGRGKALILSTGYGQTGLGSKYDCAVLQKPFTRDAIGRAIEQTFRQLREPKSQERPSSTGPGWRSAEKQ